MKAPTVLGRIERLIMLVVVVAITAFAFLSMPQRDAHAASGYVNVFSSSARVPATYTSSTIYPPAGAKGFQFVLDATARSAPATLDATVLLVNPMTGSTVTYPTTPTTATLSGSGRTDVILYPGITGVTNRRFNDLIIGAPSPVGIQLQAVVHGTAGSVTFSGSLSWIN